MVKRNLFIELNFTYRELFVLIVFVFAFSFNVNGQLIPTCSYTFTDTSGCYSLESYIEQPFTIEKKVESEEYVDVVTTPLAGDIDGDCVNELFAIKSNSTPKILIISGVTGKTIKTIKTAHFAAFSQTNFSIADIDNDGKIEIIVAASGYNLNPIELQKKLICYDLDGNVKWISDQQYREGEPEMFGSPKVADFNRDGIPDVYIYNELFNGLTGVKLTTGSKNGLGIVYVNTDLQGAISVAADLDDDPRDLELAAGYSIYKVALTNLDGMSGNQMIAYNYNNRRDGYTSIADVNNDNKLDVIVSTNGTTSALLYVYTLNNNICSLIAQGFPKYTQSNKEVSHTTIGNIKSINEKSILVTTPNLLTIFTYNRTISLQTSWEISTLDKSGHIGVTLFDFNNDGLHEIIFRDESHLQVYRSYGNIMRRIGNVPCPSWTQKEYPIITTTDVSGESKICVPCTAEVSFRGAKLTIFGSKDDNKWAPSRGVWNQYSYNPLFINDNLTIPQFQQNAANYQNKKYDNFYTQSNIIDDNGIFIKRAASMFGNIDCIHFLQESETFEVTFSISNKAESTQSVGEGLIVSFYDGDPSTTGKLLKSIEINRSIGIGQTLYNQRASFGNEPVDNLVMVVNSKKNNALPFSDSDFVQTECDYTDNISHLKIPQIITSADTICVGDSILFFGKYIKENKKHYHMINNINSCDSLIYIVDLSVNTCLTSCDTPCCYLDTNGNNVNGANVHAVVECRHLDPNSNKLNVTFSVHNGLDAGLSALNGLPISIYQNNPMDNGKLLSTIYTQTVILPGQSISQLTFTVDFNLNTDYYIVVNSDQSSPIVFNNQSSIPECQYDDNIVKIVLPEIKTDFKTACYGDTIVYNNELYVFDIEKTIIHSDKKGCDSIIIFANFKFENCNFDYKCDEKCHLVIKENHQKFQIDSLLQSIDTVYQNSILSIDIDHDCVPEIVIPEGLKSVTYQGPSSILFIDSKTGKTKKKLLTGHFRQMPSAFVAGDIDADGEPEIIVAAEAYSNPMPHWNRLICYKLDGSIKWVSDTTVVGIHKTYGGSLSLADFNHDGIPEVYYGNSIFNAQTGVFLVSEYRYGKGYISSHFTVTIAGDFNGDGNLELAAGNTVYTVDIINKNGRNGNMMTPYQLSSDYPDGLTSMSDIDEDGVLDIVVTTDVWDDWIGLYVYNFINNVPSVITSINYRFNDNSTYRISQAQITKLTKDGENCILIGLQDKIHCYKFNKQTSLLYKTWEIEKAYGSEFKGVQAFDFNNDGLKEILVNRYNQIMIYNEINDKIIVIDSVNCKYSGKLAIVGTEDESLICIPCHEKIHWIGNSGYSIFKLAIFGPTLGQRWAPARKIWHQYAYNPLFINDDGTVPQYMHNPATYKNGKYNNFMVQESLIDEDGNYPVAAASLTGTAACIDYDIATQQYTVDFSVHNRADASASAMTGLAVAFYNGNPEAGGTLIGVYRTTSDLSAGNTLSGLSYSFAANNLTSLFMIVNTDQYPIMLSDTASYGIDECDYTDNVFILPAPQFTQTKNEICKGDSYDFFGQALTASGTYIHEIADMNACDSVIVALELVVSTTKSVSLTATACDTYTWNGETYTTDGTYTHATQSVNGCDSITTLNLSVYHSDQLNLTQQSCESYTWNGQTYNQSGIYTYRTQNIHGCDSIVTLDLTVFPSIDISMTHAACDTFIWNGQSYTESGIYTFQAQTQHGCDSTVTLDLTISDVLHTELPVTACDSYTWNGQTYDTDGDYTFTGISMSGCDSIATLHLSVLSSSFSNESQTACTSFTWNNQTYDQSGTYLFQTQNAQGCDSTATLYLTIHQPTTSEQWVTACDSYYWDHNPFAYFTSGTYTQTIRNKNGCDSLMTLHLLISKSTSETFDVSACEVYYVNGNIPITYNTKFNIIDYNIYGCDSNTVYNITIHQPQASTPITENVCDSLTFFGNTLDSTGIYTHILSDQFGCDSTITLQLNILSSTLTDHIATCDSYTWPQTGLTYDTSGIFSQRFTNAVGCDSTYTLDLRILPSYQIEDTIAECGAYLWPIDGSNYDHTGRYSKRFITRDGCDSTYTLVLDIRPQHLFVDTVITNQDYLWDVNNTTYTQSGIYTQKFLTSFDCDSVHILDLRINKSTDIFFPNIISPDGINGFFTGYSQNTAMTIASLSVYDRWGNLLFHKENFPTNDPLLGWNGKFQGRDVVPGVFTWLAIIRLPDGNTSTLSGDVTVVR